MPGPRNTPFWLAIMLAAFAQTTAAQEAQPPTVTVAAAYVEAVTDQIEFIGRGEAINTVDVIARVSGYLENVEVQDGSEVKSGDALFEIERANYEATLAQRRAELASAEANLELAKIELDRKRQLVEREATPQSELDVAQADEKAAEAQVDSAKAAIQQAELDLSYTSIKAPFDGRVGRVAESVGAVVGPDTGSLVTLVQTAPIYVSFSIDDKQLVQIMDAQIDPTANGDQPYAVRVALSDGTLLDEVGRIAFGDNRIDPATGTLAVRAEFPNDRGLIVDGAFLDVLIAESAPQDKLLIPQAAIQRDQRGAFVLAVDSDNQVEQRYVTLGQELGTAIVVEDGLSEGDLVIQEGLQRVRPGVPVNAVLAGSSGPGDDAAPAEGGESTDAASAEN